MLAFGWTRSTRALGALLIALAVVAGLATPAHASAPSDFVTRINAARASGHALVVRSDLQAAAQAQAQRMADASDLFHNPNLGGSVRNWSALAENVGYGPDVATIHRAFMQSPGHRHNILNTAYTEVGIGVVVRDHVMWVAEVFRQPSGHSSAAPKPPAKKSGGAHHPAAKPHKVHKVHKAASSSPKPRTKAAPPPKATTSKRHVDSRLPTPAMTPSALSRATSAALPVALVSERLSVPLKADARFAGSAGNTGGLPPAVPIALGILAVSLLGYAARLRFSAAGGRSGGGPRHAAG